MCHVATVSKETGKEELLPPVQSISPILLEFTARAARSDLSYLTIVRKWDHILNFLPRI